MELTAAEVWTRVLSAARASLPEQSYRTWLAGSSAIALTDDELLWLLQAQATQAVG